ncbi:MAG: undecaprenyldiphospho-muramoylpentapeptide beta-N-acetylglucosaminyltransferase [Verrucomicrobiota bacterium]|jgi:UDP-N-acetylglucosamine--N-acetylmuramyl-(pentapeptide) pyrophosphoryl-undecaprenol N-acetylglucosamine transferase
MGKSLKVVIACGGTGGHLFPGIAVAEELRARGHQPLLLISQKSVDREASRKYGDLEFIAIPAIAKPATTSPRMLPFLWNMWGSIRQCKAILRQRGADAVIGMGGFTSLAPIYAARKMGLATFVHDSNALPGKANRLTARWCDQVFVGMKEATAYFAGRSVTVTGTPVRKEMNQLPDRATAAAKFGLDPTRRTMVVMGGSQGARRLNALVAETCGDFPAGTQVLHIAGSGDEARVREIAGKLEGYRVVGFCDDMASVYALADLVLCRSGASSLTELAHTGLPSILVPYPYAADDHQTKNAEVFAHAGAALLVQEAELTKEKLASLAHDILSNSERQQAMHQAALALDVPDAAARISSAIEATTHAPH